MFSGGAYYEASIVEPLKNADEQCELRRSEAEDACNSLIVRTDPEIVMSGTVVIRQITTAAVFDKTNSLPEGIDATCRLSVMLDVPKDLDNLATIGKVPFISLSENVSVSHDTPEEELDAISFPDLGDEVNVAATCHYNSEDHLVKATYKLISPAN